MNDVVAVFIIAALNVVATTILGLVITSWWTKRQKKRDDDQAELERLREAERQRKADERDAKLEENFKEGMKRLEDKLDQDTSDIDKDLELMKKTMQKDVRRSLRQDGEMYVKRKWASMQEKTEFDELYWAYHNLGRNGVMDDLHDKVMALPTEPPTEN